MIKKRIVLSIVFIILMVYPYIGNNMLVINKLQVTSDRIPNGFNGYKIVHLSDLHNKYFGKNQNKLVEKIKKLKPDLIVITGDIVDSRRYNEEPSIKLIEEIKGIAPIYYVPGNHEIRSGKLEEFQKKLQQQGAMVLRNQSKSIIKNNDKIIIAGIDDPTAVKSGKNENDKVQMEINKAIKKEYEGNYRILLSHRPEKFQLYVNNKLDLVFTGHAHGGQVRIPFLGGLIAPHQGLFPKYTSGKHTSGKTTMIVSRGLGNSIAPIRIFNRPEIVEVTLIKE